MDTEAMTARKQELRRQLRDRRTQTYRDEAGQRRRAEEGRRLLEHAAPLIALVERAVAEHPTRPRIAAFHPTPTEADVMPLARRLAAAGAQLVFPAAAGDELEWITWDGVSDFVDSPGRGFGKEPTGQRLGPRALEDVRLVLAPAVAVDRSATRIGHGAGYYDRALGTVPQDAVVVAVIHPAELLEAGSLPRDAHDVPVPVVLTADGLVCLVTSTRS